MATIYWRMNLAKRLMTPIRQLPRKFVNLARRPPWVDGLQPEPRGTTALGLEFALSCDLLLAGLRPCCQHTDSARLCQGPTPRSHAQNSSKSGPWRRSGRRLRWSFKTLWSVPYRINRAGARCDAVQPACLWALGAQHRPHPGHPWPDARRVAPGHGGAPGARPRARRGPSKRRSRARACSLHPGARRQARCWQARRAGARHARPPKSRDLPGVRGLCLVRAGRL